MHLKIGYKLTLRRELTLLGKGRGHYVQAVGNSILHAARSLKIVDNHNVP